MYKFVCGMYKFVCGLWANVAQVIFFRKVGQARSRQYFVGYSSAKRLFSPQKSKFVQYFLETLGSKFNWSKPYAMLSERVQTTMHIKNPVQCCLKTLGTTPLKSKLYAILCEKLQTTLHKKKLCGMLS